jgi:hypothetical protein
MKHLLGTFTRLCRLAQARGHAKLANRSLRPWLEILEDRAVPSTLPIGAASHTIATLASNLAFTTAATQQPFVAHINFSTGEAVPGYVQDVGLAYGAHGGLTFGWNQDNTANARDRNAATSPDELHDSLIHMQRANNLNAFWEIAVPNGTYQVHILTGDPSFTDSVYALNAEGVQVVTGTPTAATHWFEGTATVTVSDGRLTISNGAGARNNKIDAIDVTQVSAVVPPPGPTPPPGGDPTPEPGPPPGTPPPVSPGNGNVPGVPQPAGGSLYYAEDAKLDGFAWFARLNGWFPVVLHSSNSVSPGHRVVDMAYADHGTMTFQNVQVAAAGTYKVTFRYAFASGLFPGVTDREMGLSVNGQVVANPMHFPITGSFETYRESSVLVHLNPGTNVISLFNISEHGVSRVDTMTVTPAVP